MLVSTTVVSTRIRRNLERRSIWAPSTSKSPASRCRQAALRSTLPWMFGRGSTVPTEVDALPLISSKELPEGGEIHEHRPKAARLRPAHGDNGPMDHVRARLGRPGQNAAPGLNDSRAACRSG